MDAPSLDAMMREVRHTLGDIDFASEVELENLRMKAVDPDLKEQLRGKVRAAHWETRRPYVDLLDTLRRRQHRLASLPEGITADRLACAL
ncbi:hypothetical protein AAII07_53725 [Microvirga sp. 0TCS3.31]